MSRKITFWLANGDRTYNIYAEPITDKRGKIIGVITVSLDITKGSTKKKS
ncbi:hypothetical protein [Alkalihalobacillus sp. TS-13]|nr:hypothetical protein [Alkalihalobacillus sp. TS-13]